MLVACRLASFEVETNEGRRESVRQVAWNMADCATFPLDVEQGNTAFGCCVEFENSWNAKTVLKAVPYLRGQSIATG